MSSQNLRVELVPLRTPLMVLLGASPPGGALGLRCLQLQCDVITVTTRLMSTQVSRGSGSHQIPNQDRPHVPQNVSKIKCCPSPLIICGSFTSSSVQSLRR